MTAPLRLALFDCDGTLVDSQAAIVASMLRAFADHGLAAPDARAVRRLIGLPMAQAVALLAPALEPDTISLVAESCRDHFLDLRHSGALAEPLFPGLLETLDALDAAGVLLGVATGKSRRGLLAVLERHGLRRRFVTLQTHDDGPGKPHPAMVFRALDETGAEAADTVMIGDTTFDVTMARNARIAAIGVAWGYHEVAELRAAGADRIVDEGAAIAPAVLELLNERVA